jgi:hypothetical protein
MMMVSSKSQMKTRSRLLSGLGDGLFWRLLRPLLALLFACAAVLIKISGARLVSNADFSLSAPEGSLAEAADVLLLPMPLASEPPGMEPAFTGEFGPASAKV